MQQILNQLYQYQTLSREEARDILLKISDGTFNNCQIASFVTAFNMRKITVAELEGFRQALLERCLTINLDEFSPADVCGTGGDGKNTFNISTLAAFVAAGAGIKIAKHGNTGVSSGCGSSDVLQYLGCEFTNKEVALKQQISESNFCYLHAPLFHPAMKNVAPVRKEIRVKTIFNMLGPLVNPANVKKQSVGVFNLELGRLYQYLFQNSGSSYVIYHSLDGYDEISLTSPFKYISVAGEQVVYPHTMNIPLISPKELSGGKTIASSAKIFMNILSGKGTTLQNNVVALNAAAAMQSASPGTDLNSHFKHALSVLSNGLALETFNNYKKLTREGVH